MPIKKDELKVSLQKWNALIEIHRADLLHAVSDIDLSALSSWPLDCFESFDEVLALLTGIAEADPNDSRLLHDNVVDMYWQLNHIKGHIVDAEKGLTELMSLLAKKDEATEMKE